MELPSTPIRSAGRQPEPPRRYELLAAAGGRAARNKRVKGWREVRIADEEGGGIGLSPCASSLPSGGLDRDIKTEARDEEVSGSTAIPLLVLEDGWKIL